MAIDFFAQHQVELYNRLVNKDIFIHSSLEDLVDISMCFLLPQKRTQRKSDFMRDLSTTLEHRKG